MLIHDQAITVCFDVDDTMRTEIELNELFDTESDGLTLIVTYALKADWRQLLPTRVHEDMVVPKLCTPTVAAISELFAQGLYSVTSIATASRLSPSKLCRMVTTMLTTYKPCCIAVRLLPASMAALSLHPWDAMPMPPPAYVPQPPTSAVTSAPIPAPVTPPVPLLIVECATQRSLRPPMMPPHIRCDIRTHPSAGHS
jgi:hypothetical protein